MPSARELLEQADALMRRNRGASAAAAVAASASSPPPPGMPAAVPGPAAARAVAEPQSPPVVPRPFDTRDGGPQPGAPRGPADDDFPVLTDAVAPAGPAAEAVRAEPAPPRPQHLDDVPLLTDAVEEIEAQSVLDVPEADTVLADEPPAGGSDDALMREVIHARDDTGESAGPHVYDAPEVEEVEEIEAPVAEYVTAEDLPEEHASGDHGTVESAEADALAHAQMPGQTPPSEHAEASRHAQASEPSRALHSRDDPRWTEMAEEIRMQVLQRIDLFTDTGLREQLAQRLQPIVDRASADLVATINQHVGVILRAYVSEAIEREIERWRSQGR